MSQEASLFLEFPDKECKREIFVKGKKPKYKTEAIFPKNQGT